LDQPWHYRIAVVSVGADGTLTLGEHSAWPDRTAFHAI
jgi:hypothetical protein